ncbi:TIGR03088 family PEP-CTERM/XrtA system glycosyltransferase [Massilia sp. 9096]|uniref:TIGR03088 family PEP-CTERM/XrtA system glycosyltransferase n=1 Tax=Massilia sp. 9096 TaxID=1500894 RepID=UPI000565C491|nr:TIGR03088 family PEP-CTERM/XrtA system glycosyltransferase [Massilia sp. 9096]
MKARNQAPLVVHLTYSLDYGGVETLIVESINRMPADRYRHAVVCLTKYTDFANKITRPDVELFSLHKPPGLALATHAKLFKLLRRLRPAILHTYNLAAVEYAATAMLAGVPVRVHAEHGRDARDPQGLNAKHNLLRRLLVPAIDCYVPVSLDLQRWLRDVVGIPDAKNLLIDNGVDTARFAPDAGAAPPPGCPDWDGCFVIGTVGRVQDVKDHATLVHAFAMLRERLPQHAHRLRLAIAGDGPLRPALAAQVEQAGLADLVWLAGARSDIAAIMQRFSVFALSSIAEGTPVTLLEAMACGLPIVSTRVGGIPDLVPEGVAGALVPAQDPAALAAALAPYVTDPALAQRQGAAARQRIEQRYSIQAMLSAYLSLYDRLTGVKPPFNEPIEQPCVE